MASVVDVEFHPAPRHMGTIHLLSGTDTSRFYKQLRQDSGTAPKQYRNRTQAPKEPEKK